jgi:glycine/D-amino acid oxidase-like deaminating enzyme
MFNSSCPEGAQSTDVAIVGGGIAGLSAALTLAKAGVDVVVLEAETIGFGASGRNGGFVVPNLSRVDPDAMVQHLGERGELLANVVGNAGRVIFETITEENISCHARQGGWFQPACTQESYELVEKRQKQWGQRGFNVTLLDKKDTERRTGCRDYIGSWYDPTGGTLHPLKFTKGLAMSAIKYGCRIWTSCAVSHCEKSSAGWKLKIGKCSLKAKQVYICTNALSMGLLPEVENAVLPLRIYQFATRPLPASERDHLFKNGECLSDTRVNLFTYRFDAYWRLITGQIPVTRHGARTVLSSLISRRLKRHLSLENAPPIEFAWDGLATITEDYLPKIYSLQNGLLAMTGCNGRGIAMSFQMGRMLGEYIISNNSKELPIPIEVPHRFKNRRLTSLGTRLFPIYGLFKD